MIAPQLPAYARALWHPAPQFHAMAANEAPEHQRPVLVTGVPATLHLPTAAPANSSFTACVVVALVVPLLIPAVATRRSCQTVTRARVSPPGRGCGVRGCR